MAAPRTLPPHRGTAHTASMTPRPHLTLLLVLACALLPAWAQEITIYRCTDAKGNLSLRDTPCRKGETQQSREMQRPRDAPPAPRAPVTTTTTPATPASPPSTTRYVVVTPARPMYECVTPDGDTYLSDTSQGNPRWVPLWTLGYPTVAPRTSMGNNVGGAPARPSGTQPGPPRSTPGGGYYYPYGPGTWIYDECHMLPQQEVCARLRDQRHELGRRYNSALQSERHDIDQQQRDIDARLANDCKDY